MWLATPGVRDYSDPAVDYAWDWNAPGGVPGGGGVLSEQGVAKMVKDLIGKMEDLADPEEEGPAAAGACRPGARRKPDPPRLPKCRSDWATRSSPCRMSLSGREFGRSVVRQRARVCRRSAGMGAPFRNRCRCFQAFACRIRLHTFEICVKVRQSPRDPKIEVSFVQRQPGHGRASSHRKHDVLRAQQWALISQIAGHGTGCRDAVRRLPRWTGDEHRAGPGLCGSRTDGRNGRCR